MKRMFNEIEAVAASCGVENQLLACREKYPQ
jgi:hypothetical protein